MPNRDFGSAPEEPITFTWEGQSFEAVDLPVVALLELADEASDEALTNRQRVENMTALFDKLLVGDGGQRFAALLTMKRLPAALEIMRWLVSESTGRPTTSPSTSPPSPEPGGGTSTAGAPSEGSSPSA